MCDLVTVFVALSLAALQLSAAATPIAVLAINEASIVEMRKHHPLATAEVDDPVYKRKQRYQGIWLRDVLKDLDQGGHPPSELYVRFRCKDGYLPMMPFTRAMAGTGLIAIRDAKAEQGQTWVWLPDSKTPSTPAPSYLVWVSPRADPEEYPWPYQMVAIELVSSFDALADLNPEGSKLGHELFVRHCLKCHAINSVGGTFGPELNSPCSVTEYWNPRLLARFIANAGSIRNGTRMPSFDSLPERDVQVLVQYLESAARHKAPGAVCP
jgi:mono/diheme cytochrome c family protein